MAEGAIGIFDSGMGGLTVLRSIAQRLPSERMLYLGDTARLPYGTKSPSTVIRYAFACTKILIERDIKLLVVACNTASACALDPLRAELDIPVLGVVEPGARAAVDRSASGRIGIAATPSTVASGAYQNAIKSIAPDAKVFAKACPLFVPLAEEGWTTGTVPELVATEYLSELIDEGIDTLVLGCTHYPLLREVIARAAGASVALVDSAEATAEVVAEVIEAMDIATDSPDPATHEFLATDAPERFARVGSRFLGREIPSVQWVDVP